MSPADPVTLSDVDSAEDPRSRSPRAVLRQHDGVAMVVPFVDHLGGMERVALALARRFVAEGIPTTLLSCRHLGEDPSLVHPPDEEGLRIVRHGALQRGPLLDLTWVLPGALRLLASRGAFRAVLAHQVPTSGALAALVSSVSGLPFGVVTHGGGEEGDVALLRRLPLRKLRVRGINRSDFVTSLNEETDRELADVGVRQELIRRVPNGCDTNSFRPPAPPERSRARAELRLSPDETVLVYTGRLAAGKRLDVLIDAVARLPEAVVLIAGDGPVRPQLEKLARLGDASRRIRFLGSVDDVRSVLSAADVFCLPSAAEGMSVSLLEAMASAVTPLVSDVAANRGVVTDGVDGLIVKDGGAEAWRTAIAWAASNAAGRAALGRSARATVEKRFRLEDVQRFYLDWFRDTSR